MSFREQVVCHCYYIFRKRGLCHKQISLQDANFYDFLEEDPSEATKNVIEKWAKKWYAKEGISSSSSSSSSSYIGEPG